MITKYKIFEMYENEKYLIITHYDDEFYIFGQLIGKDDYITYNIKIIDIAPEHIDYPGVRGPHQTLKIDIPSKFFRIGEFDNYEECEKLFNQIKEKLELDKTVDKFNI